MWDFVQIVKFPDSLTRSIVSLFDNKLTNDVLRKYKSGELSESFTKAYLTALYNKDIQRYINWAKDLMSEEDNAAIVLYAPGYISELADIAENSEGIKRCYWENVQVGIWIKNDTDRVVRELKNVNRYSEAIEIVGSDRESIQLSDIEIVEIRSEEHTSELQSREVKVNELRLSKELSKSPELLIQLVEMVYLPDDKDAERLEGAVLENKKILAECAFHILYFGHNVVSFKNDDGVFDGDHMKHYIEQLYKLAKERKRTNVIDFIVGDILGDIPRDENYPPTALCELLEDLNNDKVDDSIRTKIYNSRGVSVRGCFEGGDQERSIVSIFEAYKEKTKLLYPRITRIFDCLIKDYKRDAGEMDVDAQINDLEY